MPDDYWDEPRFHPEHLDDNQNSNPGKQRVEPLLKDGDVVDRLKQFRLRWQDSGDLTYLGKALVDAIVEIEASRKASAPAPASGGVDAVAAVVAEELALKIVSLSVNWLREDGTDREHENYVRANWTKEIAEAKRLILAALSPAATPVSEAEPVAWRDIGNGIYHSGDYSICRTGPRVTWCWQLDGEWVEAVDLEAAKAAVAEHRKALAEPASSPAGGDVREALQKLYDGGVACHDLWFFKELEQIIAALSQSTSAGRGDNHGS